MITNSTESLESPRGLSFILAINYDDSYHTVKSHSL